MSAERPRREVAYRLFAAEFEDADYSYAESDEERAPNYVVAPTGARVNRLFVVGVLTEIESVGDDVLRARIVDPTGAFVVYAGQYQPEALAFFERADPPTFVAVTGKARTFQPEGSERIFTSIRPESVNEVTAETRDRWVVQTAEHTLDRIETFAGALELPQRGDALQRELADRDVPPSLASGIPHAIDHYGTTTGYLAAMRTLAIDAARVVAGDLDEVERPDVAPDEDADVSLDVDAEVPETRFDRVSKSPAASPEADADADVQAEANGDVVADADADSDVEPDAEQAEPSESAAAAEEAEVRAGENGSEPAEETESEPEPPRTNEAEPAATDAPESEPTAADEPPEEDTDEMYELSEEERAEVEENFDVGFETGNEVQDPGEAGIDTPAPESDAGAVDEEVDEPPADEAHPAADEETEEPQTDGADAAETRHEDGDATPTEADEGADDVDLEDAVVETMADLDDGEGAPREDLVATVREEYGVDEAAVEDAIQDALMGGRCYESGEDRLTPI
ncbi:MAG: hypothetical protein ABEJ59_00285 [Halanaeroarchaeum sp.]